MTRTVALLLLFAMIFVLVSTQLSMTQQKTLDQLYISIGSFVYIERLHL
jgi:hypothetical protein